MLLALTVKIFTWGAVALAMFAVAAGGTRERLAGLAWLMVLSCQWGGGMIAPDLSEVLSLLIHLLLLILSVRLCWKSDHPWPLWASASVLALVVIDITDLTNPALDAWTRQVLVLMAQSGLALSLASGTLGALLSRLRRRQLIR